MTAISAAERRFLHAVAELTYCNPFLPERIDYERAALGPAFQDTEPVWSASVSGPGSASPNIARIVERHEALMPKLRERVEQGGLSDNDLRLYGDGVLFLLYHRYEKNLMTSLLNEIEHTGGRGRYGFYRQFKQDWQRFAEVAGSPLRGTRPEHVFAGFHQLRRAFHMIFHYVIGRSMPAARLRAAVWQSIFTHDMRRYGESLYERMSDLNTLITGPSGTGKELVARAIGLSGYIPFDPKSLEFAGEPNAFYAVNLSALPPTLVESELFGHRRGAFTGALQDRRSWLETCEPWGAVLLDEVGDLDVSIQVKLLRLLETGTFQALGETKERRFRGRILAATNRDLGAALHEGSIRPDFYYRLCSDTITTPSLKEEIEHSPDALRELITYIARGLAGEAAQALAQEVESWIAQNLGPSYAWPGNFRELEQCVRSILVRKSYRPLHARAAGDALVAALRARRLDAEALSRIHCTVVYADVGSLTAAARELGLDRRTIKVRIDPLLLERIRAGAPPGFA